MSVAFDRAAVSGRTGMPAEAACSSSSLGKDSDEGTRPAGKEAEAEDGDGEVQSAYRGAGFAGLGALEEALPIRRGISQFYNGKSRSFSVLKDAIGPSGSAKVIAKADNAYTRKRKILLAHSIMYDKSQIMTPEAYENGIPKRIASLSRLRPLDSISPNSSSSSLSSDENEQPQQPIFVRSPDHTSHFASPTMAVPWLGFCAPKPLPVPVPMRSFSMMNLHRLHRRCSSDRLKEEPKGD